MYRVVADRRVVTTNDGILGSILTALDNLSDQQYDNPYDAHRAARLLAEFAPPDIVNIGIAREGQPNWEAADDLKPLRVVERPKPAQEAECVMSALDIANTVSELAEIIGHRFKFDVAVPIMNGAMFFAADLLRKLDWANRIRVVPLEFKRTHADGRDGGRGFKASCKSTLAAIDQLAGQRVLLIDTFVDSGTTLRAAMNQIVPLNAGATMSVGLVVRDSSKLLPSFEGRKIRDQRFLFGYGLDDKDGTGRNSPCIWARS